MGGDKTTYGEPNSADVPTESISSASLRRVVTGIVLLQIIAATIATLVSPYVPRALEPVIGRTIEVLHTLEVPSESDILVKLLIVFVSLVIGNFLYAFRYRWPAVYGTLEIAVALTSLLTVAHQLYYLERPLSPYFAPTLVELAALYIFVRGMDNIYRSFTPRSRRQQAWEKFYFGKVVTTEAFLKQMSDARVGRSQGTSP